MKRAYAVGTLLAGLSLVTTMLAFDQEAAARPKRQAESTMSGLHVDGNRIRNADGAAVRMVGVNRSSAEYMCNSNSGAVFDGPADQAEVTAMKSWKIRAVRVVLNEACWLGVKGASPSG